MSSSATPATESASATSTPVRSLPAAQCTTTLPSGAPATARNPATMVRPLRRTLPWYVASRVASATGSRSRSATSSMNGSHRYRSSPANGLGCCPISALPRRSTIRRTLAARTASIPAPVRWARSSARISTPERIRPPSLVGTPPRSRTLRQSGQSSTGSRYPSCGARHLCQYPEVTTIEIPRPTSGDVVDLILADHRLFEDLLRLLRDETQDPVAVRAALSDVLAAHAEAEERHVYPALVRKRAVEEDDVEHSTHEHLEVNEELVKLLEVADVRSDDFGEAVENLTPGLPHPPDEEEREIPNPARTDGPEQTRTELGAKFADERNRQLDAGAGSLANVSHLIEEEKKPPSA